LTHQKVCVNLYITHSPQKGMCALGIETIPSSHWYFTLFIPFQAICYFHSQFQPFTSSTIMATSTIKLQFPPSTTNLPDLYLNLHSLPPLLPRCILSTSKTCLQTWNLYFTMGRRKLTPTIKPNILKSMIEYTLISSILHRIYEMKKKTSLDI
jgi:hypothetical protein